MLSYGVTNDKILIDDLAEKIFGRKGNTAIGYIFYEDDTAKGLAELSVTPDRSEILAVGILPEARKRGLGNFFTRCLMLRLSEVSKEIVAYNSPYFLTFGFVEMNGKMIINSEKIDFPSECKHIKNGV